MYVSTRLSAKISETTVFEKERTFAKNKNVTVGEKILP